MTSDQDTKLYIAKAKQDMRERIAVGLQRTREHGQTPKEQRRAAALGRLSTHGPTKRQGIVPIERNRTVSALDRRVGRRRAALGAAAAIGIGSILTQAVDAHQDRRARAAHYEIDLNQVRQLSEAERSAQYDTLRPSDDKVSLWDIAAAYDEEHLDVSGTSLYFSLLDQNGGNSHLAGNEVFYTPRHEPRPTTNK